MTAFRNVRHFTTPSDLNSGRNLARQLGEFERNVGQAVDQLTVAMMPRFRVISRVDRQAHSMVYPGQSAGVAEGVATLTLAAPSAKTAGLFTAVYKADISDGAPVTITTGGGALIGEADTYLFSGPGALLFYNDGVNYWPVGGGKRLFDVTLFGASPHASAAVNDAAFQAAADAATAAGGGVVWVPAGRYRKLVELTVTSNVTLEGEGDASVLDYSGVTTQIIGIAARGSIGTGTTLAADAAEGTDDLDASSTGFTDGDWVMVSSTAPTGSTNLPKGEICRLADSASMLLFDPLQDSYAVADAASVAKLTLLEGNTFRNLRIVGPADDTVNFSGILVDRTEGARFENITTEYCHFYGIGIQDSVAWSVVGCKHSKSEAGGLAYGIAILNAAQDGAITCCRGWRLRHLVTHGGFSFRSGVPRRTVTTTCTASQMRNSGFDAHAGGENIKFADCHVLGSESDGFTIECASAVLDGCTVQDSLGPAFHLNPESYKPFRVTITGCEVGGKSSLNVRRGVLLQVLTGFELFDAVTISGCTFTDCRFAVDVINAETGRVTNLSITGNDFIRCAQDAGGAINIQHARRVTISGNTLYETIDSCDGIVLDDVEHFSVTGNTIELPNDGGCRCIRVISSTYGSIDSNTCSGGDNSQGISLDDACTDVTVGAANRLDACEFPLVLGTGTGHRLVQSEGVSNDNGNASVTLQHYSEPTQRWDTPLTNNRTVTLPSGNVKSWFRIVREAGATGAFNLTVAGKNLTAAGQFAVVASDGTSYRVVESGAL